MSTDQRLRFVCSGLGKAELLQAVQQAGGELVEAQIMADMEGARAVKTGRANYFLGSCATGQGGALAAAIALLGYGNCTMLGGKSIAPAEIEQKVQAKEWKAFGVRADQVGAVVPVLVDTLLRRHDLR